MAIGLSKDGKWVFNKACTTPWSHAVVPKPPKVPAYPPLSPQKFRHTPP